MSDEQIPVTQIPTKEHRNEHRAFEAAIPIANRIGLFSPSPILIMRCQNTIDETTIDYSGTAKKEIITLSTALANARDTQNNIEHLRPEITNAVMQIKAHAPLFGYKDIGEMARIMLSFLERIKTLGKDELKILIDETEIIQTLFAKHGKKTKSLVETNHARKFQERCDNYFEEKQPNHKK